MPDKSVFTQLAEESRAQSLGRVEVTVGKGVTLEQIQKLFATIGRMHGCLPCGLGGIDVIIHHEVDDFGQKVGALEGIRNVNFVATAVR